MGETKQVKTSMDQLSTGIIMMNGYLTLFASGFAVHINTHYTQRNYSVFAVLVNVNKFEICIFQRRIQNLAKDVRRSFLRK